MRRHEYSADGIAIAWAISEELIGLGAYALFATHFTALSEMADLYPNTKLWHFSVEGSAQVLCTVQKAHHDVAAALTIPGFVVLQGFAC